MWANSTDMKPWSKHVCDFESHWRFSLCLVTIPRRQKVSGVPEVNRDAATLSRGHFKFEFYDLVVFFCLFYFNFFLFWWFCTKRTCNCFTQECHCCEFAQKRCKYERGDHHQLLFRNEGSTTQVRCIKLRLYFTENILHNTQSYRWPVGDNSDVVVLFGRFSAELQNFNYRFQVNLMSGQPNW